MVVWIVLIVIGMILALVGAIIWAINRKVEWWHWFLIGIGAALILVGGIMVIENWKGDPMKMLSEDLGSK